MVDLSGWDVGRVAEDEVELGALLQWLEEAAFMQLDLLRLVVEGHILPGQCEGIRAEVDGLNAAVWPGHGSQDGQAASAGAKVEHQCGVALQGKVRGPEQLRNEGIAE